MKSQLLLISIFLCEILSAQTFTEFPSNPPIDRVSYSSVAFSDVDGDNDQDLLITGENNFFSATSKLYINDGKGIFTQKTGTTFHPVINSSIAFSDIDGDNDQDVIITGKANGGLISKIYTPNPKQISKNHPLVASKPSEKFLLIHWQPQSNPYL